MYGATSSEEIPKTLENSGETTPVETADGSFYAKTRRELKKIDFSSRRTRFVTVTTVVVSVMLIAVVTYFSTKGQGRTQGRNKYQGVIAPDVPDIDPSHEEALIKLAEEQMEYTGEQKLAPETVASILEKVLGAEQHQQVYDYINDPAFLEVFGDEEDTNEEEEEEEEKETTEQ